MSAPDRTPATLADVATLAIGTSHLLAENTRETVAELRTMLSLLQSLASLGDKLSVVAVAFDARLTALEAATSTDRQG